MFYIHLSENFNNWSLFYVCTHWNWLPLSYILVITHLPHMWWYMRMKKRVKFFLLLFLAWVWVPSTVALSCDINLLKLHVISNIRISLSFHIPILLPLHPTLLTIEVNSRSSAVMIPMLNLLIVLATIFYSNIVPLTTSWQ